MGLVHLLLMITIHLSGTKTKKMKFKTVYPDGYGQTTAQFNDVYSQSYHIEQQKHNIEFNKKLPDDSVGDIFVTVKANNLRITDEEHQINIILEKASLNGCRIQVENLAKTIINNIKYISEYVDWYTKVDAYKDSFKTYVQ